MAREFFKNLPSQETPFNSSRWNGILNGEESMGSIVVEDVTCRNMFNKHKALIGQELNGDDGTTKSNSNLFVSDYIKVNPNETYFISGKTAGQSNCFYDKDKNFISTIKMANGVITIPNNENICYVRFNGTLTEISTVQFEPGKVASNYIEPKEFNNQQIYSIEEQLIGTWNGKPLYRKTIETTFELPLVSVVTSYTLNHNIANVDKVIDVRMTDGINTMPTLSMSGGITLVKQVDSQTIMIRYVNDSWSLRTWYFVLEYTKTTD